MKWAQIMVIVWIGYQFAMGSRAASMVETRVEGPAAIVLIRKRSIKRFIWWSWFIFSFIEHALLVLFLWWGAFW